MATLKAGDKVKVVSEGSVNGRTTLAIGSEHEVWEVHDGNSHCPDQMVSLVGRPPNVLFYAWRFEKIEVQS